MSHKEDNKQRRHRSSRSKHHHHHRGSSKKYRKTEYDPSSEMERRGQNIIYDNVRKERIQHMIHRSLFVICACFVLAILVYLMNNSGQSNFDLFNIRSSREEVNMLKNKIVDYEYYIEELEERLSKYETIEQSDK